MRANSLIELDRDHLIHPVISWKGHEARGATVLQSAIAVTVSAIRLFPMVVSVLPLMRTEDTKRRHLILVAHLTAVTLWVECYRFLPQVPRNRRIA